MAASTAGAANRGRAVASDGGRQAVGNIGDTSAGASEPLKRLTIDIPASLHRAIKVQTAQRGTKMSDEVRALLESHFRP